MPTYERLLVPVDGSDSAHEAARHALGIAAATGAAVESVHVVDTSRRASLLGGEERREILREHGRKLLGDVGRLAEEVGVAVETRVLEGTPHEAIEAHADERGCDLVVMGRRGESTAGQRLVGGVTDRLLRSGALPVLSVTADGRANPEALGYGRLLVPTDGSECAERAAEHGAAFADLADATVAVVSVADVEAAGGLFDAGGVSAEFVDRVTDRGEAAVASMAAALREETDRPVETAVVRGRPAEALRAYVEAQGVDLVVMGAHGRSGVSRWLLGSVTERVLRTVDVPVLVVPCAR